MEANKVAIAKHKHLTQSHPKRAAPGTAQLTYYIFEGVLVGFIGLEMIHIEAWSGGAGGSEDRPPSKKHPHGVKAAPRTADANSPYSTGVTENEKKGIRGGPLPTGSYSIGIPASHGKLGLSAPLTYHSKFKVRSGGFYIHGQGPKGSDGCIVVPHEHFQSLMDALKKSGGGHLQVLDCMDGGFV